MDSADPMRSPGSLDSTEPVGVEPPQELLNLPWMDIHNHAHTLSWADRERYGLAGCRAMVMVASGVHWMPYDPVQPKDVKYLWDQTFKRREAIERDHFFSTRLALGIQTGARVENAETLLPTLDRYCSAEEVVAIGETGVTPLQRSSPWPLREQREVVMAQMELADEHGLPVILHTPNRSGSGGQTYRPGYDVPGYERPQTGESEPVIDAADPILEAVRIDVKAATDAGLSHQQIVASHADSDNVTYLMEETDCYLSFTIGHEWMTGVSAETVADAITTYGPDRLMMDTDCANVIRSDPFAFKRAILQLYRLGIDTEAIRTVVLENPREVFGLGE